jgi:transcriptional regulator with XRE-family HTH domain
LLHLAYYLSAGGRAEAAEYISGERQMRKHKNIAGAIDGDRFLAGQLSNPRVRHHFEQRRLVHEVAIAVRSMRMGAGLTQAQLAKRIGTTQPAIARLEKGLDVRTPRWDTLQRIATALGRQLKLKFAASNAASAFVEVEAPVRRRRGRRTPGAWKPRADQVSGSG